MAINVKLVRMITGEELIAEIMPSSDTEVKMRNPVRIVVIPQDPRMQHDPNRKEQIGLAPWAHFTEDRIFTVDKSHVVCIMNPIKDFINQYNTMFGGIVMPNSSLLVPGA